MPDWTSTTQFWLSLALAGAGCTGLMLAGRGKAVGWLIGLLIQPVWVVYAIISGGYGLIVTACMYGFVYWRNLAEWRREVKNVGMTKHGHGQVLPEADEAPKTAAKGWSEDDGEALDKENADADA